MVHLTPNSAGEVNLPGNPFRLMLLVHNFDRSRNVAITAVGAGDDITLEPNSILPVPDSTAFRIAGASSHRNFDVYEVSYGDRD